MYSSLKRRVVMKDYRNQKLNNAVTFLSESSLIVHNILVTRQA